ncbi:MarR family winged helix-turn-helix transcriptional regulator [Arcicella rosea]|uniref:DNA-binding MarR family transcriptional regulator n=1 Tax=Arcicella rosea TaxID=502909 RepID=A0A841EQP6_9BACT|nr:MarR family transcriptional regulator [Arcicella rosea]MBB6003018.1 DNA-binding MarR family transcriptional regulator [Arcicella rosea]
MSIEKDIKQKSFKNVYQKVAVNLMFTESWLLNHYSQLLKPYNLSDKQYFVLKILSESHPDTVSVNFILERMLDKMSNASRLVDKLVEKKLAVKVRSKVDKRSMDVAITSQGLQLVEELNKKVALWEANYARLTKEEIKALHDLLNKMRDSIKQ